MHFAEIFGSKSKQQNNKNFNKIALIFRPPPKPSTDFISFKKQPQEVFSKKKVFLEISQNSRDSGRGVLLWIL